VTRVSGITALLLAGVAAHAAAQGYRVRLDTHVQTASFRGVDLDSIPASDAVVGSSGGTETADGFAATCDFSGYCHFYRPGAALRSAPLVQQADATAWGFGVTGLSLRANARLLTDLASADPWPGTHPTVQLLEGYAEYAGPWLTGRAGRQMFTSRLGPIGFDGARVLVRSAARRIDGDVYAGWGLATASSLPITSPVLNPLDEYRPARRGLVFGGGLGWSGVRGSLRAEYERELESDTRYFISERAALSGEYRPAVRWSLSGGAEYDLAQGWWGTADAQLRYASPSLTASIGARHYRPHFDLWTIWGAFSPAPYNAGTAGVWIRPLGRLELRASAERYDFAATETSTPLVDVEDAGWRTGMGATYSITSRWSVDADLHSEFGPGASSWQLERALGYSPAAATIVTLRAARLRRPLELRFDDAAVTMFSLDAAFPLGNGLQAGMGAAQFKEQRRRPDAAALDWNQTRLYLRITALLGTSADRLPLPPARRSRALERSAAQGQGGAQADGHGLPASTAEGPAR